MLIHHERHTHSITVACTYWHPAMITYIIDFARLRFEEDRATRMIFLYLPAQDLAAFIETINDQCRFAAAVAINHPREGVHQFSHSGFVLFVTPSSIIGAFVPPAIDLPPAGAPAEMAYAVTEGSIIADMKEMAELLALSPLGMIGSPKQIERARHLISKALALQNAAPCAESAGVKAAPSIAPLKTSCSCGKTTIIRAYQRGAAIEWHADDDGWTDNNPGWTCGTYGHTAQLPETLHA